MKSLNKLELFNEYSIIICSTFFINFSNESYSPDNRYVCGSFFNAVFFANVSVNIAYNVYGIVHKLSLLK
jgi:hypothetical protein